MFFKCMKSGIVHQAQFMKPLPPCMIFHLKRWRSRDVAAAQAVHVDHAVCLEKTLTLCDIKYELGAVVRFHQNRSHIPHLLDAEQAPIRWDGSSMMTANASARRRLTCYWEQRLTCYFINKCEILEINLARTILFGKFIHQRK